jgi:antitoxin component of MazEF toxin-antitoxin module
MMRNVFAIQPYRAGGKNGSSLVIVIPAAIVKKLGLSPETILSLRVDNSCKVVTLEPIVEQVESNNGE